MIQASPSVWPVKPVHAKYNGIISYADIFRITNLINVSLCCDIQHFSELWGIYCSLGRNLGTDCYQGFYCLLCPTCHDQSTRFHLSSKKSIRISIITICKFYVHVNCLLFSNCSIIRYSHVPKSFEYFLHPTVPRNQWTRRNIGYQTWQNVKHILLGVGPQPQHHFAFAHKTSPRPPFHTRYQLGSSPLVCRVSTKNKLKECNDQLIN